MQERALATIGQAANASATDRRLPIRLWWWPVQIAPIDLLHASAAKSRRCSAEDRPMPSSMEFRQHLRSEEEVQTHGRKGQEHRQTEYTPYHLQPKRQSRLRRTRSFTPSEPPISGRSSTVAMSSPIGRIGAPLLVSAYRPPHQRARSEETKAPRCVRRATKRLGPVREQPSARSTGRAIRTRRWTGSCRAPPA